MDNRKTDNSIKMAAEKTRCKTLLGVKGFRFGDCSRCISILRSGVGRYNVTPLSYEKKDGRVDADEGEAGGEEHDLDGPALQGGKVEEGGRVVLKLVLLLVLVLDLALLRNETKTNDPAKTRQR